MAHLSPDDWRALEPLLDAALDLEPAERAAYLEEVRARDPERHARLEALLSVPDGAATFLERPDEAFAPLFEVPDMLGGRFAIKGTLGHGGMASVYLADDLKHGREVAVKVLDFALSQSLGGDMFRQEIGIAARLHHPHILPLFDSGEAAGFCYYVTPRVESDSLRERLRREGPLPVDDVIRIGREVADALDHAHRQGVVHRDIKPENILLQEGRALVADFGIAVAVRAAAGGCEAPVGCPVGTPLYMSPEQARGEADATARSDVYSLGVVLYELLVGEAPHVGGTAAEILTRVATDPVPPVGLRRPGVPSHLAEAVARATARRPEDRFATAHDLARALGTPLAEAQGTGHRWRSPAVALGTAALMASVATVVALVRSEDPAVPTRIDLTPGAGQAMVPGVAGVEFTLSRDGAVLVYVGESPSGGTQLWRRDPRGPDATPIPGSEGAFAPALAHDGRTVAFQDALGVATLPLAGGTPSRLAEGGVTPAWGTDGALYFSRDFVIHRVPATGGPPTAFTSEAYGTQTFPDALPGGRGLLATLTRGPPSESRIVVVGPEGGPVREILTGTMARYAGPGRIVWATARGTLLSAPFDLERLELTGPPVVLLDGVNVKAGSASQFAVSATGDLLYQTAPEDLRELVWVSRSGVTEPVDPTWTGSFSSPALSPDGRRLAVSVATGQGSDIWIKDLGGGPPFRLVLDRTLNSAPAWSANGRSLTVSSAQGPADAPWSMRMWNVHASRATPTVAADWEVRGADPHWSPDGRWLVYRWGFLDSEILGFRPEGGAEGVPLVTDEPGARNAAISPDGAWLAYTSSQTGQDEVYVRPFPNTADGRWVVSTSGGIEPVWAHGGRELFFRNGQRQLVSAPVRASPAFSVGPPTPLFVATAFRSSVLRAQYAVAPDDQHFLMIRQQSGDAVGSLVLLGNAFGTPCDAAPGLAVRVLRSVRRVVTGSPPTAGEGRPPFPCA